MNVHPRLSATSAFLTFHAFRSSQFFRERIRSVTVTDASLFVGGTTHDIMDVTALHQLVVREEVFSGRRTVDAQRLNIFVVLITVLRRDGHGFAVLQMQCHLVKVRCADDILVGAGTHRIEAHGREDVPSRSLPVVLITAIAVGLRCVELVHHLANPVLSFPGLSGIVVHVNHVLDGLVAMSIVTHVHNLHFAYLMDDTSIVTVIEQRRNIEDRIEHLNEGLLASHEVDQALWVVEH